MAQRKIAILGGGIGALTAAFELTNEPGWEKDLEVTVYQVGWRLGGKCATSRNPQIKDRIEEHGIHFLLGFYENTFGVVREVYDEYLKGTGFPTPFTSWLDAFRRQGTITAMSRFKGGWRPFGVDWPDKNDLPGDEFEQERRRERGEDTDKDTLIAPADVRPADIITGVCDELWKRRHILAEKVRSMAPAGDDRQHALVDRMQSILGKAQDLTKSIHLMNALLPETSASLEEDMGAAMAVSDDALKASGLSGDLREEWKLFHVGAAIVKGLLLDVGLSTDLSPLDRFEFCTWLEHHGCRHTDSAVIRSGYDACFAYLDGDPSRRCMSAAVAVNGSYRLWSSYKGSIFWPMRSGMAEVIFTPLYRVLSARGVKFNFFHRVNQLRLNASKSAIASIEIDVQATLKRPDIGYDPLVTVKGLECWPNEPLYDQLVEGQNIKGDLESAWAAPAPVGQQVLRQGVDFDDVILGISIGAFPVICRELIAASPTWDRMIKGTPTVQTQAMQLWVHRSARDLGFRAGTILPTQDPACVSAFVKPYDTYGDLSDLRPREGWSAADNVQQLAFFCTTMTDASQIPAPGSDPGFPARELSRATSEAKNFVERDLRELWPNAVNGAGFDWSLLVDPDNRQGPARFEAQYVRANIDPSSRYVLSPPGTFSVRLRPEGSGFGHLYLAGDWTFTPMNSGCVEAATMSGLRAAHAVLRRRGFIHSWKPDD